MQIKIQSKSYFPITTIIGGRTIKIPPKGKTISVSVTKVTDHLIELEQQRLINVIKQ